MKSLWTSLTPAAQAGAVITFWVVFILLAWGS